MHTFKYTKIKHIHRTEKYDGQKKKKSVPENEGGGAMWAWPWKPDMVGARTRSGLWLRKREDAKRWLLFLCKAHKWRRRLLVQSFAKAEIYFGLFKGEGGEVSDDRTLVCAGKEERTVSVGK